MKANSAGLEIEVSLSEEEVKELSERDLQCNLKFDDTMLLGVTKRKIPMTLRYVPGDKARILAEHKPDGTYFGKADNCTFTLYGYHHLCLLRNGFYEDRFRSSGKITIRTSKHL